MAHDFVTDDECARLKEISAGKLTRATVAGPDGTSMLSPSRKANQAHYSIPRHNPDKDFLWPAYKRALSFANIYGKLNVQLPGQEGFTIIQYDPTDEYAPRKQHMLFFYFV